MWLRGQCCAPAIRAIGHGKPSGLDGADQPPRAIRTIDDAPRDGLLLAGLDTYETEVVVRAIEVSSWNEPNSLERGSLAISVANCGQLVLRLFHFLAFQSGLVCLPRAGGSRTYGNVFELGERRHEHCSFMGKHKICAIRGIHCPQGVRAVRSHLFSSALAIDGSFTCRRSRRM